ncbi:MAG: DUF445 family protein [Treponema sp.]|jgi:uncharacterized membrane protein YheB (UPF0754 family)|nr:DUF445 family protein [Treponema sp.]
MKTLLVFAVPPLAGAVIGFVTNVIAIKMLFRPLGEVRVFGIRLPFTPGLLPRQRHKLAQSIGAMVERELLAPDILRQRLRQDDVRETVLQSLSAVTGTTLDMPLEKIFSGKTGFIRKRCQAGMEKHYRTAAAALIRFLRRADIHMEMQSKGRIFLHGVIQQFSVFQRFFISAAQYDQTLNQRMPEIIDDFIDQMEDMLQSAPFRKTALELSGAAVEALLASNEKTLRDIIPSDTETKKLFDNYLCSRLLNIVDTQIENILAAVNVKTLVSDRIDSLEMIRVEKIILDVMANQLKWIDVFGALLGFLIGLFQSVFVWFMR